MMWLISKADGLNENTVGACMLWVDNSGYYSELGFGWCFDAFPIIISPTKFITAASDEPNLFSVKLLDMQK